MSGVVALVINAYMPAELLEEFMQRLRDFDEAHPDKIHVQVWGHTNESLARMKQMMEDIDPPFDTIETHKKN